AVTDTVKASNFAAGNMTPNRGVLVGKPGGTVYAEALAESGKSYIVYLWGSVSGGNLTMNLPAGTYDARWINPGNGQTVKTQTVSGSSAAAIASPAFSEDMALLLRSSSAVQSSRFTGQGYQANALQPSAFSLQPAAHGSAMGG
ncbi:MAG: hypothetical protein PHT33_03345, partial [bacterium]|nr:hypothetical protein [bacterium]